MIRLLIKKEIFENLIELKFRIVILIIALIMILSNLILFNDFLKRNDEYSINQPKIGTSKVAIKPTILSIYNSGLSQNMEKGYDIKPGSILMLPSAAILTLNFISSRFPIPDFSYIVRVILSLLVMVITYDSISGEKVKGTLQLILASSVSRTHIVIAKILGSFISFVIPFTLIFLLNILILELSGEVPISSEDFLRIFLFYLSSILYLSIFISLAVTISSRTSLPTTSLVTCLILWVCLVFGIANISESIAGTISPLPSAQVLDQEKILTYSLRGGIGNAATSKQLFENIRQKENDYRNSLDIYIATVRNISRVSPSATFSYFSSSITRSGIEEEQNFKYHVLQYRNILFYKPEEIKKIKFSHTFLPLSIALHNSVLDFLLLIFYSLLFFLTAFYSFLNYDVRK